MAMQDRAATGHRAFADRRGRGRMLIALALLAIAAGALLAFGIDKPRTRPREGKTVMAHLVSPAIGRLGVSTVELVDCEAAASGQPTATTPAP